MFESEAGGVRAELVYDRELQGHFLRAYLENFKVISAACNASGVRAEDFRAWRKTDPVFREALSIIDEEIVSRLKARAYNLALSTPDGRFVLEVIERDDPSWDIKLRHIKESQATPVNQWNIPSITEAREILKNDPYRIAPPEPAHDQQPKPSTGESK